MTGVQTCALPISAGPVPAANIRVTFEGENHPLQIPVPADTILAARVVAALGPGDALAARTYVKLRQGKVVVTAPADRPASFDVLVAKIRTDTQIPIVVFQ